MKHASTLRLYRCWAALKGRNAAPARADLRPHLLGSAMLDLFTLRPGAFMFGYAGSRARTILPQALDNRRFDMIWRPGERADILRLLRGIVMHSRPVLVGARRADAALASEHAEILLLPMIETSGETGLIGIFSASRDWMTSDSAETGLALASISSPEPFAEAGNRSDLSYRSDFRPLRPRLVRSMEILNR